LFCNQTLCHHFIGMASLVKLALTLRAIHCIGVPEPAELDRDEQAPLRRLEAALPLALPSGSALGTTLPWAVSAGAAAGETERLPLRESV